MSRRTCLCHLLRRPIGIGLRGRVSAAIVAGVLIMTATPAFADPITREEAAAWVAHVRRLMGWGPAVDLAQDAETRLLRANIGLIHDPGSREFFRDRGDAFHTLGHLAEHKHRFEEAINLHREAIESYSRSGYGTRESWSDGRDHAREHIFMNLYDLGVFFDRNKMSSVADRYFRVSLVYAEHFQLYERLGGDGDRFGARYRALGPRVDPTTILALRMGVETKAEMTAVLGELRCAAIFVPMYSN